MEAALSVMQVARRLNVSERTARKVIASGDLRAHRVGRQLRVFEADLQAYLARNTNRHPPPADEGSRAA